MNGMYKSATLKLTAWYLALVMAISLTFSGVVYHFATDTLANGLDKQQARIYREFPVFTNNPFFVQRNDVEFGSHRILTNLAYFNIIVLIGAGFASYWLARRTLEPIEKSNEQQRRFVADASHELRTPLTALRTNTEVALLDGSAQKTELRAALQSNLEDIDTLSSLLVSLLRLSQLDTATTQLKPVSLSLANLADDALRQVAVRASAKHITIDNKVQSMTVVGDRDSIAQLLVILLDNAIKYSPDHSSVTITSQRSQGQPAITIADQGIGIEQGALDHVFDRFYRADKARSGNDGFGLGLSIAKQIADLNHGTITLTSVPGKGTKASLCLPSGN